MSVGRTAKIELLEGGIEAFAQAWVDGATRRDLAKLFGVEDLGTITRWTQRDDVKSAASKLIRERALKIKRRVDSKIETAVEMLDPEADVEKLLKIRKEYAPDIPADAELSDLELLEMAFSALDENPELAAKLQELQADAPTK